MTTAKQLGLGGVAFASVGAATASLWLGAFMEQEHAHLVIVGGIGILAAALLLVFWRGIQRSVKGIAAQLATMVETGKIGLVMDGETGGLAEIARPLNEFLSSTRGQMDQLQAENRELQLQCRISAAEKKQTEAIIFSISDAVIVTNRFDELLLANDAAEKLLGFDLGEALRKNVDRVLPDGTLVRLIRETRAHGRSFTRKVVEHTIDRKGTDRTFTITLSCIETPAKEVGGVVAVLHDVTREKEISRMKTDFVSNVSHELKTPLSSIKAYIEMLVDGEAEDEETRGEFYNIISTETDRLHRLIENILNLSRIESGVVKTVREPISLTGVAKQALDVAAPQARLKSLELVGRLAPVYYQVEADRDMVYQAILNLVSNAVKYTPEGGTITVSVDVDEPRGVALCEVSDTGLGIPADDLPHIFDKFYRVGANKRAAKGTGLGLALVKHIVETAHDGKLSVTSEAGKGSTFSFELPLIA